ncbi:hypothetical protein NW768_007711 [Fusarium equiseti]|uniref:DUF4476 domain-containing protein n=1 Tax=Fusarium equiseti TaxID=61235 RepID=A0ABQ8R8K5_FUSEQ|nr:hypothetical protein NW768_007711 [Fusarium equiseti]
MSNNNANSASGTRAPNDNLELHQQFKELSIYPRDPNSEQLAQEFDAMDIDPNETKQDKTENNAKAGPSDAQVSITNTSQQQSKPGYTCEVIDFDDTWGWQPAGDMFDPLPADYYEQAARPLPQVQEDPIGRELSDALDNLQLQRISKEDRRYVAQLFMEKPYADVKLELEIAGIVYDDLSSEDLYDIITIMTRAD